MTIVTALFIGSFNPPTRAHQDIVARVSTRLPGVPVWLVPVAAAPHKVLSSLAAFSHRLAMTELFAHECGTGTKVSRVADSVASAETLDLLQALKFQNSDMRFVLVMGADVFVSLPYWKGWRELMENYGLYILPRPGLTDAVLHATIPAHTFAHAEVEKASALCVQSGWYIDKDFAVEGSSTAVRQGAGDELLLPAIRDYIAANRLY